jgi:hypothetical protein
MATRCFTASQWPNVRLSCLAVLARARTKVPDKLFRGRRSGGWEAFLEELKTAPAVAKQKKPKRPGSKRVEPTVPRRPAAKRKPSKRMMARIASGEATREEYASFRAAVMFSDVTGPAEQSGRTGLEVFKIRCEAAGCTGWGTGFREWKKGKVISESPVRRCQKHEGGAVPVVLRDRPKGLTSRERRLFVKDGAERKVKSPKGQQVYDGPVWTDRGVGMLGKTVLKGRKGKVKEGRMSPARPKRYELRAEQERKWPVEIRTAMVGPGGEYKTPEQVLAELATEDRPRVERPRVTPKERKPPALKDVIRTAVQGKRLGSLGEAMKTAVKGGGR